VECGDCGVAVMSSLSGCAAGKEACSLGEGEQGSIFTCGHIWARRA
jgi:hypothetical protein